MKLLAPDLLPRDKWFHHRYDLCVGDLVIEIEPNVKRGKWKMAVISEVFPGSDGHVRRVRIKTAGGLFDRPVQKLCLIATNDYLENG